MYNFIKLSRFTKQPNKTSTIMSIIIAALQDVIILGEIKKKQQSSYREEADIYCEE